MNIRKVDTSEVGKLAERGAPAVVADRNLEGAQETESLIHSTGGSARFANSLRKRIESAEVL